MNDSAWLVAGPTAAVISYGFVDSSLVRCEPRDKLPTNLSAPLKHNNDNVCVFCVNDNSFDIFILNTMECSMTLVSASRCVDSKAVTSVC